jgi:hypothetical protein
VVAVAGHVLSIAERGRKRVQKRRGEIEKGRERERASEREKEKAEIYVCVFIT